MEFPRGIKERACWNSSGQIKKKWNLQQWSRKIHVEFPSILVFPLGISKGCHTTLWNIQWWSFAFSRISKSDKSKNPRFFFKIVWTFPFSPGLAYLEAGVCICSEISLWYIREIFCFAKIKSILNVLKH